MVAVVTGSGLGLLGTSSEKVFADVGQQGGVLGSSTFGRYGENVTVNASTGNLIIGRTDEVLIGIGPDDIISRGYNSQSQNQGYDSAHSWQFSDSRAIVNLQGTINHAGSSVTRIDADGANTTYNYDGGSGTYICTQAGNAEYRLSFSTSTNKWTWTDAKNNYSETYDAANGGRLCGTTDTYGNSLTYTYDSTSGLLTTVTTADGETTAFTYTGGGTAVQSIVTTKADSTTLTRVYYTYDSRGRLSTVSTDLTPATALGSDTIVTTYSYAGTSDRVNKIVQTGGAELDIGYTTLTSGAIVVQSLTQVVSSTVSQTTHFAYNTGNTVVTDANGQNTTVYFDSNDQLTSVTYPPDSNSNTSTYAYSYTADGNLHTITDAYSNIIATYTYDTNDNLTTAKDFYGNKTVYTYDTNNHVVTKTSSPGAGQTGTTSTTRYAYNSDGSLRFVVDADGEVSEYRYDGTGLPNLGLRTSAIGYSDNVYDLSALISTDTISESQLTTWVNAISDKSTVTRRTDYAYDFRGNLTTTTSYSMDKVANGTGLLTQPYTQMNYVYDQAGNLLQRNSTSTGGPTNVEYFHYDGLNRVYWSQDLNGAITNTLWTDGSNSVQVTLASGLVTTSSFDEAGNLTSVSQSTSTAPTTYLYDALGEVSVETDPDSIKSYFLYDNLGRKTADIAADGSITEYRYDLDGRLVATISHNAKLNSTQLGSLIDIHGNPTNPAVSSFGLSPDPADVWNWRIYDNDSRLIETINGDGGATSFAYDNMSNLISTTSYYNKLSSTTLGSLQSTLPTTPVLPSLSSAFDDTSYAYYDAEGRVVGTQDGDGNFSQIVYDHAGEKIDAAAYATQIVAADRTLSFSSLVSAYAGTADDHTRFYYDDRGLMTYSLDAMLRPTQYVYDASGRLVETVVYGAPIASTTPPYTLSYVSGQVAGLSGNAANRTSWMTYDATTGNLIDTIDATGMVTHYIYDQMGNVVVQTQYADTYMPTSPPSQANITSNVTPDATNDRTTRFAYDAAGRLSYTIDAENFVTENRYDNAGRMTLTIRYATAYGGSIAIPQKSDMDSWRGSGAIPSSAIQTGYGYDTDGHLQTVTQDVSGVAVATRTDYDALGRAQTVTAAYGTADASKTFYTYDNANRVLSVTRGYSTSDASTTSCTYDGQGNVLTATDGNSKVTHYVYDPVGQLVSKTDPSSNITLYTYDVFGNVATTTDPLSHVSYAWYDALNRVIMQVDQGGYATATTYNVGGAVASVKRYAQPVTVSGGIMPSPTGDPKDATTTFQYDKLDRVVVVTDAEGFFESYTLDAFGDRVKDFAKSSSGAKIAGGETDDVYGRRGEILQETLPVVSYNSAGTALTPPVLNTYSYDAFGNLKTKVEASGLPEARTTTYTYDGLNRLKTVTGDAVTVVDDNNINSVTTGFVPVTTYVYDRRGNVISTTDAAGGITLSYYDHLDRKIAQIDALNDYSAWTYDDNGNMLTARTYATAFGSTQTAGGTPPTAVNPTLYRQTSYAYDDINRLTTTTVSSLLTGSYGTSYTTTTGDVTTTNAYDKSINALRQTDGNGNSTYTYYDNLGRKIAEVDQNNYITLYALDSNGNVLTERRNAKVYTGTMSDTTTYATVSGFANNPTHQDTVNDRVTNFEYDRNGNRITETRLGVTAFDTSTGAKVDVSGSSIVGYTYNGLGEVQTKTEATGDKTTYTYDAGGRQTVVDESSFVSGGLTIQEHTVQKYDGLGDLVYTDVDDANHTAVQRITSYNYGAGGRLASVIDPTSFERDFSYDKMGRTVLVSYLRQHSNGSTTLEADVTQYDLLGRVFAQGTASKPSSTWNPNDMQGAVYDAFGEVVSKSVNGITQQTFTYDTGGRMWKSTDEGIVTLYIYDKAGNQTLSVTSDGTAALSQSTWNGYTETGTGNFVTAMGTIGVTAVAGMAETITVYDARNQATQVRQPNRQIAGNATAGYTVAAINTSKTYNAFGEVLSETDANSNTTTYVYNTMGKVIQQVMPSVSYTNADGTSHTGTPTQNNFYDLSGRLVGVQDANGNINLRALLDNTGYDGTDALVTDEYHADSGHVVNTYDAFGDLLEATNEVGAVTDYTYDKDGNVLTETHPLSAYNGTTRLVDTYTYDGLGERLTHYNSQLTSSVKETTDYDAEGRVTATVDMGGHETDYAYAWVPAAATTGLGTYGGWTKTTTNTAALTMTDTTDADGRTIGHVDFGGNTLSYKYNIAGWLQERDNTYGVQTYSFGAGGAIHLTTQGEALTYTYFNTGLKQEASSTYRPGEFEKGVGGDYDTYELDTDTLTSDYAYDKDGNETFEDQIQFLETFPDDSVLDATTLTQYETATFDAMNRITEMKDSAAGVTITGVTNAVDDPVDITLKYDLAGNIRNRHTTYYDLDNSGTVLTTQQTQDDWYTYDGMNRFLISKGTLASGAITYSTNGTLFTYDKAGERATATSAAETDTYTYAKDGYLTETDIVPSGGGSEKSTSAYDLMGRVITYKEYDTTAAVVYSKVTTYNALGQDTTDTVFSNRGGTNGAWTWVTTYDYNALSGGTYTGQYQGGNIVHDHTHTTVTGGPTAPPDSDSTFGYIWFDSSMESGETYKPDATDTWTSYLSYDPRESLYEANIHDGQSRDVFYSENLLGEITQRDTGTTNGLGRRFNSVGPHARYYYFGGIRMGDVSNDGTSDVNYVTSITDHKTKPGTGLFQNGGTTETKYADFDASYDPINGLTYQDAPGSYTVQGGDTLQSIAQQIWGDANFWYLLADANGMDLSTNLVAGQTLIIPNKVANNQNNDGTYRVYDPNDTIGNVSPTTPPKPQPHQGPKCGIFGQILEAIITVMTGNLGGQLFGLATGIQKSFNWDSFGMSVLSAFVPVGLGELGVFTDLGIAGTDTLDLMAQGALSSAVAQGIGVATGLQKSFDWGGVAAAAVSAGVGHIVGQQLGGLKLDSDPIVNAAEHTALIGMAGLIANASARSLINGTDFGDNILKGLPDVMGQTIGSAYQAQLALADQQATTPAPSTNNLDGSPGPATPQASQGADIWNPVRYFLPQDENGYSGVSSKFQLDDSASYADSSNVSSSLLDADSEGTVYLSGKDPGSEASPGIPYQAADGYYYRTLPSGEFQQWNGQDWVETVVATASRLPGNQAASDQPTPDAPDSSTYMGGTFHWQLTRKFAVTASAGEVADSGYPRLYFTFGAGRGTAPVSGFTKGAYLGYDIGHFTGNTADFGGPFYSVNSSVGDVSAEAFEGLSQDGTRAVVGVGGGAGLGAGATSFNGPTYTVETPKLTDEDMVLFPPLMIPPLVNKISEEIYDEYKSWKK
jgi:trimeric autotransporter adhesin